MTVEQRSGTDRRQAPPWIDHTIRPPGEPEVELNPVNDEVEVSFSWDCVPGLTGSTTYLIPRAAAEKLRDRLTAILAIAIIPAGLI